ncbi:MAG: DUF6531 domain-containing protein [Phycisphaerales bacterium]
MFARLICVTVAAVLACSSSVFAQPVCPADCDMDGELTLFDFLCFQNQFASGDPAADCDGDGSLTLFDFLCFQNNFAAGCDEPAFPGDPNPNAPGEKPFAVPGPRGGCAPVEMLEPKVDQWVHGVYPFSGETWQTVVDFRVKGRVLDFVWARRYRSQSDVDSAMGVRWDFSYNIFLEADGIDLVLHDGFGRINTYEAQGDGTWARPEFFRAIRTSPDGSYVIAFANRGEWRFLPLDGSAAEGRISAIVDRNGNTMSFEYDAAGRLETIRDDLNRVYTLSYGADGRLDSICDFTGRCWTYDHYGAGEMGGSPGDLKSVTTAAVVGTPTGNDFPDGKTTTYTYTQDTGDERLDHLLLTVTDASGVTRVANEYAATTSPGDLLYGRLVRQTWGDPGDVIDLVYVDVEPAPENNFAEIHAILNDREGHVKDLFYDGDNRGVLFREYTGLADPDLPTTLTENRPGPPVRGPETEFVTRWSYNDESMPTLVVHPNLNETELTYDDVAVSPLARGNLLERRLLPGPLGGDQLERVESFTYLAGGGGCCGSKFVTSHTDFRGNTTTHEYDAFANRTRTIGREPGVEYDFEYDAFGRMIATVHPSQNGVDRRRDEYAYYADGPARGYRERTIVDAGGLDLTTTHLWTPRGYDAGEVDAEGRRTDHVRNQLDQVVRTLLPQVTLAGTTVRYTRDRIYDGDDNVVRRDVSNIDENGMIEANLVISTTYTYGTLDELLTVAQEIDESTSATTRYSYDANRNRVLIEHPAAVAGSRTGNSERFDYTPRDLVWRHVRGPGTLEKSSTSFSFDGNRQLTFRGEGLEGDSSEYNYRYTGFGDLRSYTDPMKNRRRWTYDANGNAIREFLEGELIDVPGPDGNVILADAAIVFDGENRRLQRRAAHFDRVDRSAVLDGVSITEWTYNGTERPASVTNDNGNTLTLDYDTAYRSIGWTDEKGNRLVKELDGVGNVVANTTIELSDLGSATQAFTSRHAFDAIDRRVTTTDSAGNITRFRYDSRNNLRRSIDPLGNVVRHAYDGRNLRLRTERDMTDTGTGAGSIVSVITTEMEYDLNGHKSADIDDEGNRTTYERDALNRVTRTIRADGTVHSTTYDFRDNAIQTIDSNGSVFDREYDANDRPMRTDITPGPGVSGDLTFLEYAYDGEGRRRLAIDDDSSVEFFYDSLGHNTRETTGDGFTTSRIFDGVGNMVQITYPSGRVLDYAYDNVELLSTIHDGIVDVGQFFYIGKRVERRLNGNGTRVDYTWAGIDGVANPPMDSTSRGIVRTRHTVSSSGAVIEDRLTRRNALQSRTRRVDQRLNRSFDYEFDSAQRLVDSSITQGIVLPITLRETGYELDDNGQRERVTGATALRPGDYFQDATLPEPADDQMNQYTQTSFDERVYDRNGNTTVLDEGAADRLLSFNAANQLVELVDQTTGQTHVYSYDAGGRRTQKVVDATGVAGGPFVTRFLYGGDTLLEERDTFGQPTTFTWCDGSIPMAFHASSPSGSRYAHRDQDGRTHAATDDLGFVIERLEYGDHGEVLDATSLLPVSTSLQASVYLVGSASYFDFESGFLATGSAGGIMTDPRAGVRIDGSIEYAMASATHTPSFDMIDEQWDLVRGQEVIRAGSGWPDLSDIEVMSDAGEIVRIQGCILMVGTSVSECRSQGTQLSGVMEEYFQECCQDVGFNLLGSCLAGTLEGTVGLQDVTDMCEDGVLGGADLNGNGRLFEVETPY